MRRIIIDCDPGLDDAIAICLALANKDALKIEAITTVAGNQTLDKVTINALKVMELLCENIDVVKGASSPIKRELFTAGDVHGTTGMDGPILPDPIIKPIHKNAVDYIAEKLRLSEEKLTIVAIGPLTNIALLISRYPDVKEKIEQISIMGGGLHIGNVTPEAEFNAYVDPEAAKIVFNSNIPIIMSSLDVTTKAYILKDEYEVLRSRGKVSKFVCDLLDFYRNYAEKMGYSGSSMHDACSIMHLIHPDMFESEMHDIDVICTDDKRGKTVSLSQSVNNNGCNTQVLVDIDRTRFIDELFNAFITLDKQSNA